MKVTKILFVLTIIFSSCAALQEMENQWRLENCNVNTAYSNGVEDAQNGEKHDASSYSRCHHKKVGKLKKSYSEGYNSVANNPFHIIKNTLKEKEEYYRCEVDVWTTTYVGGGRTIKEAKFKAMEKCMAYHHEMQCDDFSCSKF